MVVVLTIKKMSYLVVGLFDNLVIEFHYIQSILVFPDLVNPISVYSDSESEGPTNEFKHRALRVLPEMLDRWLPCFVGYQ